MRNLLWWFPTQPEISDYSDDILPVLFQYLDTAYATMQPGIKVRFNIWFFKSISFNFLNRDEMTDKPNVWHVYLSIKPIISTIARFSAFSKSMSLNFLNRNMCIFIPVFDHQSFFSWYSSGYPVLVTGYRAGYSALETGYSTEYRIAKKAGYPVPSVQP